MVVTKYLAALATAAFYFVLANSQSIEDDGNGRQNLDPVEPGTPIFRRRMRSECVNSFRTLDGSCTNEIFKMQGSSGTPLFSYIPGHSSRRGMEPGLPSARLVSNIVCSQNDDVFNNRDLSEFVVFFGQFIDHNIVATVANPEEPMPIEIPPNDPTFGNTTETLHFVRNLRGAPVEDTRAERAINILSSALDLAAVYASDVDRARLLRTFQDGMMNTSAGNLLPFNMENTFNAPTSSSRFFLAGDHRSNEHPVLTALHVIFLREHNRLATELKKSFPDWVDDELYNMARKINGAQFQKIVFDEWYPMLTGRALPPYRRHRINVNPTVSDIFTTAAFRLGHTMVGNVVPRRDAAMNSLPSLDMSEIFFAPQHIIRDGIESFIRGSVKRPAQEIDTLVHSALRNFLFTNVQGEEGFDLIALNLQRSRDHDIPSYNNVRQLFGLRPVRQFSDITRNQALQNRLQSAYGTVDRIEAWVGLVAEDHVRGSSMGRTMLNVWRREFIRMRDGDLFFFENPNLFSEDVLAAMPSLRNLKGTDNLMRNIILRNSEISNELQMNIWRV